VSRRGALFSALVVAVLSAARGQDRSPGYHDRVPRIDASRVEAGQRYRFKLSGDRTSVWEIVAVAKDEVRYRIHRAASGKEVGDGDAVHVFSLDRKFEGRDPPPAPRETLRVSGIDFECTIQETELAGSFVRTWRSDAFPEVLKVQLANQVVAELAAIDSGR
jgi:hypothetical protein